MINKNENTMEEKLKIISNFYDLKIFLTKMEDKEISYIIGEVGLELNKIKNYKKTKRRKIKDDNNAIENNNETEGEKLLKDFLLLLEKVTNNIENLNLRILYQSATESINELKTGRYFLKAFPNNIKNSNYI